MLKKKLLTDKTGELHEELEEELARVLQEEIDREVLFGLLEECGWTRIELPSKWFPVSGIELHEWRQKNLTGKWKAHENTWLFEKEKDATIFALRWA